MVFVCYVRMYLKFGKWDRVNAVKMVNLAVQVRRIRFPCGTNRFPLVKTERYGFWVAGNRFPRRDNPGSAAYFLKMFYFYKTITFDPSIRFMCRFGRCEAN